MLRIERYKNTRHWALYDGQELVVVTVYRRGAAGGGAGDGRRWGWRAGRLAVGGGG